MSYLVKAIDNVGNYSEHAARFVLDVTGVTPKNIIIEQTFTEDDFTVENDEIILPVMDMGVNFQDFRVPKETRLIVDCSDATEIQYRHAFSEFNGWDYLEFADDDETTGDNWEDEVPPVWSDWKSYTQEPEFCGQYVQVKLKGENTSEVKVTADIDDVEDFVSNIDIPAEATTVTLNKNFTIAPVIIPTTVDATGKVCSWRVSSVDLRCFDIELLDNEDNIIAGKLLSATARGY
ncbi:MAG: hypothetical protein LBK53_01995 [Heliobacteriaceae bacterium]|nr:hypothetical protein [Heliobacteriaceae bacterium]